VTSLSHNQLHVWIDYIGDIITRHIYCPLQQQWLFLTTWVKNINLHHLVQSK